MPKSYNADDIKNIRKRIKKCWICGADVNEKPEAEKPVFFSMVRLVTARISEQTGKPVTVKSKPVWVCSDCTENRIGIDHTGKNLNPSEDE